MDDNEVNYKRLLHEAEQVCFLFLIPYFFLTYFFLFQLKKLAFFGVLISTVATLTAAVAIPMLYSYSIGVSSSLQEELNFCAHRTQTLRGEFDKVSWDREGFTGGDPQSLNFLTAIITSYMALD